MKRRFLFIAGLFFLCAFTVRSASGQADEPRRVIFFFSPGCHSCMEVERRLLPPLQERYDGMLRIEYKDVNELENYTQLIALLEEHTGASEFKVPVIFFEGTLLVGKNAIAGRLDELLSGSMPASFVPLGSVQADLLGRFRSFRPLALIGAGLADGINPCAFTVIVFFISFLTVQGYRRRELVCIGSAFILAVFLTYLFIGLGIFNFLYRLRGFWVVTRLLNAAVGGLSIVLGFVTVYDILLYRKSGRTEGMVLQLPAMVKQRIHAVVGYFYRQDRRSGQRMRPGLVKLSVSALLTGFLVSLLEAVCTGQLYLPTIIFVFKTTDLKLQAFNYLLLYNTMFIVPLVVIFVFSLLGATSAQFSRFLRRHLVATKTILALVFFGLGIFLLRRL